MYAEKQQQQLEYDISIAYYNAIFQRAERLPQLSTIINKIRGRKEMTNEDMLAKVKSLNAMFGGEVVIKKEGDK